MEADSVAELDLDQIRGRLQNDLRQWKELRERIHRQGLREEAKDSTRELSLIDNHPGDFGSEMLARSQDLAYSANLDRSIETYEQALRKIDQGTYGICEQCGRPIDPQRLEAKPEAALCLECQQAADAARVRDPNQRPIEEEVLAPPFARTFLDGADQTGFDGEDSWQAVARYGTSETPSDLLETDALYPNVYEDATEARGAVQAVEEIVDEDEDR